MVWEFDWLINREVQAGQDMQQLLQESWLCCGCLLIVWLINREVQAGEEMRQLLQERISYSVVDCLLV